MKAVMADKMTKAAQEKKKQERKTLKADTSFM